MCNKKKIILHVVFFSSVTPILVRLVNGSSGFEGRVEVSYDGSWGTVCDEQWDHNDANVVCRMLGYHGALRAPISDYFGEGSESILLNSVACTGSEDSLADCSYRYQAPDCDHGNDAGVICLHEEFLSGIETHSTEN